MSGWRQEQYLDQAYNAMALQPARSAVAVSEGFHWKHLMTEGAMPRQ